MFCIAKGRLLHLKRASFTVQKVLFYNPKEHLLKTNHEKSCQQLFLPIVRNVLKSITTVYPYLLIAVHNTNFPPSSYSCKCVLSFYQSDYYTTSFVFDDFFSEIGLGVRYNDYRGDLYKDKAVFFVSYAVVLR